MSKWLVLQTKHFYDGHREEDEGNGEYFITDNPLYTLTDPNKRYEDFTWYDPEEGEDLQEFVDGCDAGTELYAEDGYHCTAYSYRVVELSDKDAILANLTIKAYSELDKHFKDKE